jgi:hypothetical protein
MISPWSPTPNIRTPPLVFAKAASIFATRGAPGHRDLNSTVSDSPESIRSRIVQALTIAMPAIAPRTHPKVSLDRTLPSEYRLGLSKRVKILGRGIPSYGRGSRLASHRRQRDRRDGSLAPGRISDHDPDEASLRLGGTRRCRSSASAASVLQRLRRTAERSFPTPNATAASTQLWPLARRRHSTRSRSAQPSNDE